METLNAIENADASKETHAPRYQRKTLFIGLGIAALLIGIALFVTQGYVVAATVNGTPISRLSVIRDLEQRSGKQALEAKIRDSLITSEIEKAGIAIPEDEVNAEIEKIKQQVTGQGGAFEQALAEQGMTEAALREEIVIQKGMEKLLEDKVQITEADVDAFVEENKIKKPQGLAEADFRSQVLDGMKRQKFQTEAQAWIADLEANANITYYVDY